MLQGCLSPVLPVFLSTPSARRATLLLNLTMSSCRNFYPRPPRGGRPFTPPCRCVHQNFYPRPPRGGRPPLPRLRVAVIKNFYPRPPRGGRHISLVCPQKTALFLSTPSARRATHIAVLPSKNCVISIHALREEGDPLYPACGSRSSKISIHALREEGDTYRWSALKKPRYFYPRPPRGGRHILQSYPQKTALFLSTPSARRATRIENKPVWRSHNFYPRPPRGGRPQKHVQMGVKRVISIHALREEGDDEPEGLTNKKNDFYPRPPRGGRPRASFSSSFWI